MENSLERINREYGAQIRGRMGVDRGNDFIRSLAEKADGVKYPLFGREND